jgi:hypothetical protein
MAAEFWHSQLDALARQRFDQRSFHAFAEGMHSDARGQIFNLRAGDSLPLWTDQWPHHLFIVLMISGDIDVAFVSESVELRELSQLVVLPGTGCTLSAKTDSSFEILSFHSQAPSSATEVVELGSFERWPLHDAVLREVRVDWTAHTCTFFVHAFLWPGRDAVPCLLHATSLRALVMPHRAPWGESLHINGQRRAEDGRFLIEMQTGDVIEIEADSFEFRRNSHIGAAG